MSILGSLFKTTFDVVTLPVAVVEDIVTLGGATSDQRQTYTGKKLAQIGDDLDDVSDDLGSL